MTEREAIIYLLELLEELAEVEMPKDYDWFFDSVLLAKKALEKQIAKKPVIKITKSSETGRCPNCKKSIDPWEDKYVCHHCLQRLDWSDEE